MGEAAALVLAACLGIGGEPCGKSAQAFNATYPGIFTHLERHVPYPKVIIPLAGILARGGVELSLSKSILLTMNQNVAIVSLKVGF